MFHAPSARPAIAALAASRIREVANAAMGNADVLPFWFGEPDEPTPAFIREAAIAALAGGDTFYTANLGIPTLREALAAYVSRLHRPVSPERIAVTSSGVSALMLAAQALAGHGDRVVAVTPLWPNLVEIPKILGALVACVPLEFGQRGWTLDVERLLVSLDPDTRVLVVNSPNNPTGWTLEREAQRVILDHCRRHGIWIVSDEAYDRLHYRASGAAPSFLDLAAPEDRLVVANTFSKSWLMTGWRLGWLVAPERLVPELAKLIEYNTSCAPGFVQRAGVVAVTQGEDVVARTLERFRAARDFLVPRLNEMPGVRADLPAGAMYAFFAVERMTDSLAFCKRLVADAGLGLAPGVAFGPEGEGFVRWCFAASEARLADGLDRLARGLARARG